MTSQRSVYLAGFWRRFFALIIDSMVVSVINMVLGAILALPFLLLLPLIGGAAAEADADGILTYLKGGAGFLIIMASVGNLLSLWTGWLYFALMESSVNSATLGKMALGIVVSDKHGRRITFERATARYFSKFITGLTFFVGYIMAAFSSRKQALHDFIAGTLVLYRVPADYHEDEMAAPHRHASALPRHDTRS